LHCFKDIAGFVIGNWPHADVAISQTLGFSQEGVDALPSVGTVLLRYDPQPVKHSSE